MRTPAFLCACLAALLASPAAAAVDYLRDIKPILAARCTSCHGAIRQKSGLRLDTAALVRKGGKHGPAVVPGKSGESLLIDAITGKDRPRMPPEQEGASLTDEQIGLLRKWIDEGAQAPDEPTPPDPRQHWAFRPPVRPAVPVVSWGRNAIDAFVAAQHTKHQLVRNPPADKPTLFRRVYLDLIGLPPSREELHAFLADPSPDAYEKVVDHLLSSPLHGERWGRHWMDVWRYSDPFGLGEEYRYSQRHIWRWRDWIIESLNQDKGYDRMIVEMLAGDEVAPADPQTLRATGYLARNWYKFNRNAWLQDTVEYTAAGFLGITLRCARCHDHKYDPLSQQDYYRFRAFFEPHEVRIDPVPGEPDVNKDGVARAFDARMQEPTYLFVRGDDRNPDKSRALTPAVPPILGGEVTIQPAAVTPQDYRTALAPIAERTLALARTQLQAAEAELRKALDALEVVRRQPKQPAVTQAEMTVSLAAKKWDAARAAIVAVEARIAAERGKYAERPDRFLQDLAKAAAKAERQAVVHQKATALARMEWTYEQNRLSIRDPENDKQLIRYKQLIETARKELASAEAALSKDDGAYTPLVTFNPGVSTGRRLALARWIASRDNPLTARVAVNHLWLRHFGKPLVPTVANFGLAGQTPTHPELLDWLATQFMDSGWSMKHLHRLIVTSETYRLSSATRDNASAAKDPENRYLWRMNSRRMEAEVVRDSLLAAAGQLDPTLGGPILSETLGLASRRRSVYFRLNTEYKMPFLDLFDLASPNECYERRESVIPQQALALYNSTLALNESRLLARRMAVPDDAAFIAAAFEQVLGRPPTTEEQARCNAFLRDQAQLLKEPGKLNSFPVGDPNVLPPAADPAQRARENLVQVLFNHNDFVTVR